MRERKRGVIRCLVLLLWSSFRVLLLVFLILPAHLEAQVALEPRHRVVHPQLLLLAGTGVAYEQIHEVDVPRQQQLSSLDEAGDLGGHVDHAGHVLEVAVRGAVDPNEGEGGEGREGGGRGERGGRGEGEGGEGEGEGGTEGGEGGGGRGRGGGEMGGRERGGERQREGRGR